MLSEEFERLVETPQVPPYYAEDIMAFVLANFTTILRALKAQENQPEG